MGRGRGRRYFRFNGALQDGGFEDFIFDIYSLQEDGTPSTFDNAIEVIEPDNALNPGRLVFEDETETNNLIRYRIGYTTTNGFSESISFVLEDNDGNISNGLQFNGFTIDLDRAQTDIDYILDLDLIGFNSFVPSGISNDISDENISLDTAFDDTASTEAGQSVTIDVLANDLDVDDDDGFEFSADPNSSEGGTVEIEHGQILFTPTENFVGTDSFTYNLLSQDGEATVIDTATVTVEVSEAANPANPADPNVSFEPVFGTLDGDVIEVEGENQLIFAGSSNDLIDASTGEGENRIYAGSGDDTLIMGQSDRAFGGNGSDRFFFTAGGNNTITGGEGADQFWIATAEIPDAPNTITDFTIGEDVIGIAGLEIGFGEVTLTQQGNDALIATTGNDLALLEDIDITNLSESDFAFG